MENNENSPNLVEVDEVKSKKPGFFKRLKRRVSSVFQRKPNRKRNNSDPCIHDTTAASQKQDSTSEQRLSLNEDDKETDKAPDIGDGEGFRPPAKAHVFVNDFTAELKQSLKMRSKMVEEGQASNAIMQIEMSRSNYSVSEEENQAAETERKTFEEKVALFESQISGGSLNRDGKLGDEEPEKEENEGESKEENDFVGLHNEEETKKANEEHPETMVLEISKVNEKGDQGEASVEVEVKEGCVDYELNVSEDHSQKNDEKHAEEKEETQKEKEENQEEKEENQKEKEENHKEKEENHKEKEENHKEKEENHKEKEENRKKSEENEKESVKNQKESEEHQKENEEDIQTEGKHCEEHKENGNEKSINQDESDKPEKESKEHDEKENNESPKANLEEKEKSEKEIETVVTKHEELNEVVDNGIQAELTAADDNEIKTIDAIINCHEITTDVNLECHKEDGKIDSVHENCGQTNTDGQLNHDALVTATDPEQAINGIRDETQV